MEFNKILEEWKELREASLPWLITLSYFVQVDDRVLSRLIGERPPDTNLVQHLECHRGCHELAG